MRRPRLRLHRRPKPPTYGIEGSTPQGYPVWAAAQTPQEAIAIYKSFGGDITKAKWIK